MNSAPSSNFPILLTPRLKLRALTLDDAAPFHAILSIPEVTRFSNWPDSPSEEESLRIARNMSELFPSGNGCAWVIEHRSSSAFIGAIRFNYFMTAWKCGGIGYELHPDFWGQGLMTEALREAVTCGHKNFCLNRIEAWTLLGNGASDRVLEKGGFRYEGTLRQRACFKGLYHDTRMFGRVADDLLDLTLPPRA